MNSSRQADINLDDISEEELLKTRICSLPLTIEGTWLESCMAQLYSELDEKGILFHPSCYLADEWLTPEGQTCIGIPFYLTHPTLIRLEKKYMMEAEGETKQWCLKLLRHEAGHAMSYAYNFHKRKKWQRIFGPSSREYGETYKYRPYSKNFVRHLDGYYAQYHPDEDFVETFAVWLTPSLDWRTQYKNWKAIKKLEYVDELMTEIKGKTPVVKSCQRLWRLATLRITLQNYYRKKRHLWAEEFPDFHDDFLHKVFLVKDEEHKSAPYASALIRKYRRNLLSAVSKYSGERKYIINELLKGIQKRCQALKLVCSDDEGHIVLKLTSYVTALMMNYFYTGRFRGEKRKERA